MTTVAQLIGFLQTLPPETEVEVLGERRACYETYTAWEALDLGKYSDNKDFTDFTDERWHKCPSYGKRILQLGGK